MKGHQVKEWKPLWWVPPYLKQEKDLLESQLLLYKLKPDREDHLIWTLNQSGSYSVCSTYIAFTPPKPAKFPPTIWQKVWKSHAWPKGQFFLWSAVHDKILTGDQLCKRG